MSDTIEKIIKRGDVLMAGNNETAGNIEENKYKRNKIQNYICIMNNYQNSSDSSDSNEKVANIDNDKNYLNSEFSTGYVWLYYTILTLTNIFIVFYMHLYIKNYIKESNFWLIVNFGFGLLVLNIFTFGMSYYLCERQFKINQEYKLKFRKIYHRERMELVRSNKK